MFSHLFIRHPDKSTAAHTTDNIPKSTSGTSIKPGSCTYTIHPYSGLVSTFGTFQRIRDTYRWELYEAPLPQEEMEHQRTAQRARHPEMRALDFASIPQEPLVHRIFLDRGTASTEHMSIRLPDDSGVDLTVWLEPSR
ncbi:uncharacterized protein I303_106856 [Kwoniella dejecticola CBS 10117]|uniref:Uncharacterized protein n=1 Tax=Kwoniella dejecticola CBS 10117 TaxID=1296121 RepID=A0A1A5ZTM2_9TREE|nr:uncharacterized protein I303_08503 [Kwoniella dejecticola CBS 10117]OBR81120.1 hypothetical protein I303_08503 [Kwoniella dejecticola CBS 10117]